MASCVRNIATKNYQNVVIGFQVTVENVGDVFLGHSVVQSTLLQPWPTFIIVRPSFRLSVGITQFTRSSKHRASSTSYGNQHAN